MDEVLSRLAGLDVGAVFTEEDARELDAVFVVLRGLQERLQRAYVEAAAVIPVKDLERIMAGLR